MNCLCLNTRRAARTLTALYEEHLRPCDLTPAQFGLLSLLAARPGLSQAGLAHAVDLDQTTLSRNLQLLVGSGLATRTRTQTDRRQTLYTLTPAGLKRHQGALPHWTRAQERMRAALGADWEQALEMMQRLSEMAA